jgi:hypothetical protein
VGLADYPELGQEGLNQVWARWGSLPIPEIGFRRLRVYKTLMAACMPDLVFAAVWFGLGWACSLFIKAIREHREEDNKVWNPTNKRR